MRLGINKKIQAVFSLFILFAILYGVLGLSDVLANTLNAGSSLHVNQTYYTCTWSAASPGNWSTAGNWTNCGGGTPRTGDYVVFDSTSTQNSTIDSSYTNQPVDITINSSYTGTITQSAALTITGNFSQGNGSTYSNGGYDLSIAGSTTIGGGSSGTFNITSASGTKTFTGLVTIAAGATWNNSGNSAVYLRGGLTDGGSFTAGTGGYYFEVNNQEINCNNSRNVSITGLYVNGVTVTNKCTGSSYIYANGLHGTGGLTQDTNSRLYILGDPDITTLTATASGNTVYYFVGSQTIFPVNYYNLTLRSGTKTFQSGTSTIGGNLTLTTSGEATTAANLAITGNLVIENTCTFTAAGYDLSVTGTTNVGGGASGSLVINSTSGTKTFTGLVTVAAGATWNNSANEDVTMRGGLTNSGTFTAGSGVYTFDTNSQNITCTAASVSIPNMTVTGVTVTNKCGPTYSLTVGTALSGTGGLTQFTDANLYIGGTSGITSMDASTNSNVVEYNGAGQTIHNNNYSGLILSGSGTKTLQTGTTTIGALSVQGTAAATTVVGLGITTTLNIGNGATFTAAGYDLTVGGTTTVGGGSSGSLVISSATGTKIFTGLITLSNGSTWNNSGNSGITLRGGLTKGTGTNFSSGSGTYTFDTNNQTITCNNSISVTYVAISGITVTHNCASSNLLQITGTLSGTGTIKAGTNSYLKVGQTPTISNWDNLSNTPNTVEFYQVGSQTIPAANYYDLVSSGTAARVLASSGIIGVAGTFNPGTNTYTVTGSTVNYNGTGSQSVAAFTYNNLTITKSTVARTVQFPAGGTVTVNGTWTVAGESGKLITLTSSSAPTQWNINPASASISYVDVNYSNNTSGSQICATYSQSTNGNNTNWAVSSGSACNYTPAFTANPHEDPTSDDTTPTNVGANLVIKATATDANSDQWYLAVCKTNAISAGDNAAPTCTGGSWAISTATNSGSEATATYGVTSSETNQSYDWYAFACDKVTGGGVCTSMSNGGTSGNNGSPFAVNHGPVFNDVSNSGPKDPGGSVTISALVDDSDSAGTQDTVSMYVCKSADFNGSACTGDGTWCSTTGQTPGSTYWLSGYGYRTKIPVSYTTAGKQTNYTKSITIVQGSGTNTAGTIYLNSHALDWPEDIRFTKGDGTTQLDFYREEYDATDGTWHVELDAIGEAGNTDFYVYYGKSSDTDASNGANSFVFFDDFSGSLSTNWNTRGTGTVEISSGELHIKTTSSWAYAGVVAKNSIDLDNRVLEYKSRVYNANTPGETNRLFYSDSDLSNGLWTLYRQASDSKWILKNHIGTTLWSSTSSVSTGTNYRMRVYFNDSQIKIEWLDQNYSNIETSSFYDYSNGVKYISFLEGSTNDEGYFDDVRVRKFANPEPAWATPGSEIASQDTLGCSFNVDNPHEHGTDDYYVYMTDSHSLQSASSLQGSYDTFTVNDVAPSVSGTPTFNGSSAIDLTAEGSTTNILVKGVATDDNGCGDLAAANTFANAWQTTLTGQSGCNSATGLPGYSYRASIPVSFTSAGAQTNYTKQIAIVKGSGANSAGTIYLNSHALNWPYDIRFTKSDGVTPLDYYREEYDTTDGTWHVELDSIAASGDTNFYVYYGKASDSDASNGTNSFIFFDDFELNNFSRWDTAQSNWSVQSSTKYEGTYAALGLGSTSNNTLAKTISPGRSVLFHAYTRITNNFNWYCFVSPTLSSSAWMRGMCHADSYFKYYYGGSMYNLPTSTAWTANTWYKSEVAFDYANQLFRWWVNGTSKGSATMRYATSGDVVETTDYPISAAAGCPGNTATNGYLDLYWVRAYAYPEPAWATPGSEEAAPTVTPNSCYYHASCVYDATYDTCGADDKTGGYTCTIPFQYYANPTDANTPWASDTWTATFIPGDGQGASANTTNSGTRELNSYLALGLASGYDAIGYGSMAVGAYTDPLQEKTRIEATGNCSLDVNLSGTAMSNGGNSIAASYQKYGLGGTAPAWSSGTALSGTPTLSQLNVCKSGYTAMPEWKPLWWGVEIPTGTLPLSYTGTNTITAVKNGWASTGDWCE